MTTPDNEAALEIQHIVRDFRPQDGDMLGALHAVQHHYGYIPQLAFRVVARQLRLSEARVYGCATYYSEFKLMPPPETTIGWCSGPACHLKGGDRVRALLECQLEVGMEETTPDGKIGLHFAQCNGTCEHAPQVWINGEVVGPLTSNATMELVRRLKDGGAA
jgi:NADH-quinone oxidoreductase subunit E